MVYDNTKPWPQKFEGERGYTIYQRVQGDEFDPHEYSLYTDDGWGNGDYVCGSEDYYWINRIAHALDKQG